MWWNANITEIIVGTTTTYTVTYTDGHVDYKLPRSYIRDIASTDNSKPFIYNSDSEEEEEEEEEEDMDSDEDSIQFDGTILTDDDIMKMGTAQLKDELGKRGRGRSGLKSELQLRLKVCVADGVPACE